MSCVGGAVGLIERLVQSGAIGCRWFFQLSIVCHLEHGLPRASVLGENVLKNGKRPRRKTHHDLQTHASRWKVLLYPAVALLVTAGGTSKSPIPWDGLQEARQFRERHLPLFSFQSSEAVHLWTQHWHLVWPS